MTGPEAAVTGGIAAAGALLVEWFRQRILRRQEQRTGEASVDVAQIEDLAHWRTELVSMVDELRKRCDQWQQDYYEERQARLRMEIQLQIERDRIRALEQQLSELRGRLSKYERSCQ